MMSLLDSSPFGLAGASRPPPEGRVFILYAYNMVDTSILVVIGVCLCSVFVFYRFKLYASEKHKSAIQLLIGLNVVFTVYILYSTLKFHKEEIGNTYSMFYEKLMSGIWGDIQSVFMRHPQMKYFYDELYNGIEISSNENRDEYLEQIISFKLLSKYAHYAEYYYSHRDLSEYKDTVLLHNEIILKTMNNNLKSAIFRDYVDRYLSEFGGVPIINWFKEFYDISPSSMENTNKAEYINNHSNN